ncbi:MAG TPA: uracil phosphoribosyltransferase [Planctomycetes bacterium]|nr:uracil phosphoribosyltransferase [Planctomycetota bacterium]HIK61833.1 uracil phosphoribosyltransferase [Planctomycetota bacterium]
MSAVRIPPHAAAMPNTQAHSPQSYSIPSGYGELEHRYGPRVHILDNPLLASALAHLSGPKVSHAGLMGYLRMIYRTLCVHACGRELPTAMVQAATRMAERHPAAGIWRGEALDPTHEVVVCDIVRGGIVPSQICFELLNTLLPEQNVRLDHLTMARVSNKEGRITGVDLSGSKIGGTVAGRTLLLPDPMGATGSTTIRALDHYREEHGEPERVIAMPMIATPEYLRAVLDACDSMVVYTARLDRGLSDAEVLASAPGEHWDRERGLDDSSYIVPGAGGVGEVVNNSWC